MQTKGRLLLNGEVTEILGCKWWQVARLIKRGRLPEVRRLGRYRAFTEDDLPAIRAALIKAGYVKGDAEEATPCR